MNPLELITHIFMTSMVPLAILAMGGYIIDQKFNLDIKTLSKLNFFIFLPSFVFTEIYEAKINLASLEIVVAAILIVLLNYIMTRLVGLLQGYDTMKNAAQRNLVMFTNAGNIGVALSIFIYSNAPFILNGQTPYLKEAISAAITVLLVQTTFSNTFGFYQARSGRISTRDAISIVFHMPMIYVVPLALIFKFLVPIDLTQTFIFKPLTIFGSAFVPIAMVALGLQINRTSLNFFHKDVMVTSFLRIIMGPFLALLMIQLLALIYGPLDAIASQVLIIMYATPSAVNMGLIAMEMRNNPEYTTQVIMATTILSAITMPIFVMMAYQLFPL